MSFQCPECPASKSLEIALKIELPPDSHSDEITLQIVECSQCGFAGIAVYEESRRGALGTESFDHTGYYVNTDDLKALRKTIKRCPQPKNWRCDCEAHRVLGRTDDIGRWSGLNDIHREKAFPVKL